MDQSRRNDQAAQLNHTLRAFINSPIVKRSVMIAGHATSVSLEQPFWDALMHIAKDRDQSLNALITEIDDLSDNNLSSSLRLYVLQSHIN